jgi:hypothetical protein
MEQGFPCRPLIASDELFPLLDLSPDGSQLLMLTEKQLLVIDIAHEEKVRARKSHDWKGQKCLKVDWVRGQIAIGAAGGFIVLLGLQDLEETQRVQTTPVQSCAVAFTNDGQHVVAAWENWMQETQSLEQKVQVYSIGPQASQAMAPMTIAGATYIVPGAAPDALWYVSSHSDAEQELTPVGPSGEKVTKRSMTLRIGRDSLVRAVSESRGYILVGLQVFDLKSGLPLFELYNSKVKYGTTGGSLPHLTPRLGADLMYERLERLSHDFYWDPYNQFMSAAWGNEYRYRERGWLWMASLVTKRRARYDAVWFSLLLMLRDHNGQGQAYLRLSELTSAIVQLNTAEHLLHSGDAEKALMVSKEALRTLRAKKEGVASPRLDLYAPTLEALVLNYWDVLERELWLVLGQSFAKLERRQEAALAYREVLQHEPQEWRAYDGLLKTHLEADDATFHSLLEEAQTVLRLRGWTDRLDLGFPDQFFHEHALESMRLAKDQPVKR